MQYPAMKRMVPMVILFLLVSLPPLAAAAGRTAGELRGFVYGDDGKRPLGDASVLLRGTASQRILQSALTTKNGAYVIELIPPGTYAVGILWQGKEYNVDVLIQIRAKKQLACFTLPRPDNQPGYQVRCSSPACFFVTPCGWALVAGATAGITYGIVKIAEKEVSPTGI